MIEIIDNSNGSLAWSAAFLRIDEVCYFKIEGEVGFMVLERIDSILLLLVVS